MKLTAIRTANYIGARSVDINLAKPITIICGRNHSGKSSLVEAIRHALTGETTRVTLKRDFQLLVSTGASSGYAAVDHDGQQSAIILPNGAHEHTGGATPLILPYVLNAQLFSSLPENERRQFLFGLMGLRTDGPAVVARLIEKGCDQAKSEAIAPHLRAGFDAAHKEAQSKARDAKASWRAITGETYGSVKAAGWRAPKPEHDGNRLRLVRDELHAVEQQIEQCASELAVMQSNAARQAQQSEQLAGLRAKAVRFSTIQAKLIKDEAELKEWQAKSENEARKGGKQLPTEPTYACPACAVVLRHDHASGALIEFTPPPQVAEPIDPGRLAEYQRARDLLARSVENDKRDLADADLAAKTLTAIEDAKSDPAPAPEEIKAKREKLDALRKEKARLSGVVKQMEDDERAAARSDERTRLAGGHHAEVAQWEQIADALAPNGIPGDLLANALEPVNDRLALSAKETGWLRAGIDANMNITGNGRPALLLSESENWRVDAMIAEAISHLSGVKLMVLDRFDVLDLPGRADMLYWLDGLASSGDIDTCLLFATLKSLPSGLPESTSAVWIENGTAGKVREAA